jgi:drug/metabolite transporter (DMT)-like permease
MGYLVGVGWALAAAVAHTGIDVLRKYGASKIRPLELVGLTALFDAVIATSATALLHLCSGQGHLLVGTLEHPGLFWLITSSSSILLLVSKVLYNHALHIAPLSLTVPYLAFTPAILVLVAYVFIGERPTGAGLVGVMVVTLSGFLLGTHTSPAAATAAGGAGTAAPSSPSKRKASAEVNSLASLAWMQQQAPSAAHPGHVRQANLSSAAAEGAVGLSSSRSASGVINLIATAAGSRNAWAYSYQKKERRSSLMPPAASHADEEQPLMEPGAGSPQQQHHHHHQQQQQQQQQQSVLAWDKRLDKHIPLPAPGLKAGVGVAGAATRLLRAPGLLWGERLPWQALLHHPPQQLGPIIVLVVAAIWSVTASLDKMGTLAAPSMGTYFVAQRLLIGGASLVYILCCSRRALRYCWTHFGLLCSISLLEQCAVLFFLLAINNILVSYVVAIKRVNVLFSTILACLVFKESVVSRLPYILVMLCGMLIIVLQPGHENLDHNHHTLL